MLTGTSKLVKGKKSESSKFGECFNSQAAIISYCQIACNEQRITQLVFFYCEVPQNYCLFPLYLKNGLASERLCLTFLYDSADDGAEGVLNCLDSNWNSLRQIFKITGNFVAVISR